MLEIPSSVVEESLGGELLLVVLVEDLLVDGPESLLPLEHGLQ